MNREQRFGLMGRLGSSWKAAGWREVVAALLLVAAAATFLGVVHRHYPIQHWLFWRYAGYWTGTASVVAGMLGVGCLTVMRGFRVQLPTHELTVTALAVGLFEFELVMQVVGWFQLFGTTVFFLVPAVFLALGRRGLGVLWRRWRQVNLRLPRLSTFGWLSVTFGTAVLCLIYFAALTPENVQFDSRWKHLSLAEDWVAWGGVRRRDEGWLFSSRPHMTSLLYVWGFLTPGARLFDKMVLCAHLEVAIFVITTVVGVPAIVRRLVPNVDPRLAWATRFLFPGVLLYDSSVSAGADHVGALFGVPAALMMLRLLRDFSMRPALLMATVLAAGCLVKETIAIQLVPFPAAVVCVRAAVLTWRRVRSKAEAPRGHAPLLIPLAALGTMILLSSPLWAENWAWYGDPLYPSLSRFFSPTPWSEAAAYRFKWGYLDAQMWAPSRDLKGLWQTVLTLGTFSFVPNDWPAFHGKVPVFGSLFTLLIPLLLLCRGTRRTWLFVGWVHAAVFVWYSVHHQDRYLQGMMPVIAATTTAMMVLIWRQLGRLARAGVTLLVAIQLVWGGDVYFFQTHTMAGSPVKRVVDLLSAGYSKKYTERFNVQGRWQAIGRRLPKDARLLIHETNINLGTGVTTVLDSFGWQYAIEYGEQTSPVGVFDMLRRLGVTHIFTIHDSRGTDSIAGDIRFFDFILRSGSKTEAVSGGTLLTLDKPPQGESDDSVLVLSCGRDYKPGRYQVNDLSTQPFGPRLKSLPRPRTLAKNAKDAAKWIGETEYVVFDPGCFKSESPDLEKYRRLTKRRRNRAFAGYEIYARKR